METTNGLSKDIKKMIRRVEIAKGIYLRVSITVVVALFLLGTLSFILAIQDGVKCVTTPAIIAATTLMMIVYIVINYKRVMKQYNELKDKLNNKNS